MICEQCGGEIKPLKNDNSRRRFCSKRCSKASADEDKRRPRFAVCGGPDCDVVFAPPRQDSRYCSRRCGWRATRLLRQRRTPVLRHCKDCGEEFIPKRNQVYCSATCRRRVSNRRYRESHKEQLLEIQRKWRAKNPTYYRDYQRRSYKADPEKFRERARRYYEENREDVLVRLKERRGHVA